MTTNTGDAPRLAASQHSRALDRLGQMICSGELEGGASLTLEEIEAECEVSRSVARETVRVLESMGLVESRRRVGVIVQPAAVWNLYDPQVIRWRLASPDRADQLASMVELRAAIEPEAARLAASRATSEQVSDLIALSGRLWAAGERGDDAAFLELDVEFHAHILELSGNPMFSRMGGLISQALVSRKEHGLGPEHPAGVALQKHVDVASAIQRRDPDGAHDVMRSILVGALDEIDVLAAAKGEPRSR